MRGSNSEFAVVSVETTGLNFDGEDRITELAVIRLDSRCEEVSRYTTLLSPGDNGNGGGPLAEESTTAPEFSEVAGDIVDLLRGAPIVGHDVQLDLKFLEAEFKRAGLELPTPSLISTQDLIRKVNGKIPGRKLHVCCSYFGIDPPEQNSAYDRANATAELFRECLHRKDTLIVELGIDFPISGNPSWPEVKPSGKCVFPGNDSRPETQTVPYIKELVSVLPASIDASPQLDAYLGLLDKVLEEQLLASDQSESLLRLGIGLGLERRQLRDTHLHYFAQILEAALTRGRINPENDRDLQSIGKLLSISQEKYSELKNQALKARNRWTIEDSASEYLLRGWGEGFFKINELGNIAVRPEPETPAVDLLEIVTDLKTRGIKAPVTLRFDGIIRERIHRIQSAFLRAIEEKNYKGSYRLAYPIKVNQHSKVIEVIRQGGVLSPVALEVGSKPELLAVLSIHDTPESMIICNGYKDREYMELAAFAVKLGRRPIVVIEQFHELELLLEVSEELDAQIDIGMRMKLMNCASGQWASSSGVKSKFGLTTSQILAGVSRLRNRECLNRFKLLHYHAGSQISSIKDIKRVLREASRMYVDLAQMAPELCYFDVGGGLAVDYDGSGSESVASMNYTEMEYARDVVEVIQDFCDEQGVDEPTIITESGRATVAHHSVLILEVTDVDYQLEPRGLGNPPSDHPILKRISNLTNLLSPITCRKTLHDLLELREQYVERYIIGDLTLEERAYAGTSLRHLAYRVCQTARNSGQSFKEIAELQGEMTATYLCNFSLFQSIPDFWALGQLFPILPIHRLDEKPKFSAVLADLTCDSDGRIDRFIGSQGERPFLRVHGLRSEEPYYLGIFLGGAYQEILGEWHNLFGNTHAAHVEVGDDGSYEITHLVQGDTLGDVLEIVNFSVKDLTEKVKHSCEQAVSENMLDRDEAKSLLKKYRQALNGYTYLVKGD